MPFNVNLFIFIFKANCMLKWIFFCLPDIFRRWDLTHEVKILEQMLWQTRHYLSQISSRQGKGTLLHFRERKSFRWLPFAIFVSGLLQASRFPDFCRLYVCGRKFIAFETNQGCFCACVCLFIRLSVCLSEYISATAQNRGTKYSGLIRSILWHA